MYVGVEKDFRNPAPETPVRQSSARFSSRLGRETRGLARCWKAGVTPSLDTSFLLAVQIVEQASHAEALHSMSAYLPMDTRDDQLAEICFDRRGQA